MHLRALRVTAVLFTTLTLAFSAACGETEGFDSGDAADNEVRLVQQPWEDLVVENEIVSQILEGYSQLTN